MAKEAGIYMELWRPEEIGITKVSSTDWPVDGRVETHLQCVQSITNNSTPRMDGEVMKGWWTL